MKQCINEAIKHGLFLEKENQVLLCIDVGCNINKIEGTGTPNKPLQYLDDFTQIFLNVCEKYDIFNVKIIGFEPLFYQRYEQKYQSDTRISCQKIALYDEEKMVTMKVPGPAHGLSSIVNRPVFEQIQNEGYVIREIEVQTKKLDDLFLNQTIDYLKLDTEGSEMKILQGASNLLKNKSIRFLQIEKGETHKDAGVSFEQISSLLSSFDFQEIFSNSTESVWKAK